MIKDFGWSDALQAAFEPHAAAGLSPARVVAHHRGLWRLVTDPGTTAETADEAGRGRGSAKRLRGGDTKRPSQGPTFSAPSLILT